MNVRAELESHPPAQTLLLDEQNDCQLHLRRVCWSRLTNVSDDMSNVTFALGRKRRCSSLSRMRRRTPRMLLFSSTYHPSARRRQQLKNY